MCLFYLVSNCLAEHGILVQKFLSFRFPSMTPIFRGWGPGTCPLILLSHLSYFMPFHLFAFPLYSGGFGELYRVMILLSFFFFSLSHFNFWELFYVLWMLGFLFFSFELTGLIAQLHYILLSLRYLEHFYFHVLFPPFMALFSPSHFFFVCFSLIFF